MIVDKVGVACRDLMPPVPEQFADERQILARHDGMTCGGMSQVMQPQPTEPCIRAHRPPASDKAVLAPAFGVSRKYERIGAPHARELLDMRPRGLTERHRTRAGLGVRQIDGVIADVAPAKTEYFSPPAYGERQQPNSGDGLGPLGLAGVERAATSSGPIRSRGILPKAGRERSNRIVSLSPGLLSRTKRGMRSTVGMIVPFLALYSPSGQGRLDLVRYPVGGLRDRLVGKMGVTLGGLDQGITDQLGGDDHIDAVHGRDRSPGVSEVVIRNPSRPASFRMCSQWR